MLSADVFLRRRHYGYESAGDNVGCMRFIGDVDSAVGNQTGRAK